MKHGIGAVHEQMIAVTGRLAKSLDAVAGVRLLVPPGKESVGVVSFNVEGYDPHEAATLLEQLAGVEGRAGLHCAPQMHAALGSEGAVRLSVGGDTSQDEIDSAVQAVEQLAAAPIA